MTEVPRGSGAKALLSGVPCPGSRSGRDPSRDSRTGIDWPRINPYLLLAYNSRRKEKVPLPKYRSGTIVNRSDGAGDRQVDRLHPTLTELALDTVSALEGCVQTCDRIGHDPNLREE